MSRSAPLAALLWLVAAPVWGQTAATPAPTRLWAAQTTANQITLVWTGSAGATGSERDAWTLRLGPKGSPAIWIGFDKPAPIAREARLTALLDEFVDRVE